MKWLRKLLPHIEQNSGEQIVQKTALRIDSTDRIRQIIRHELYRQRVNSGAESFEEADDFDFDDGEEWVSPYENEFEPESGGGQSPPVTAPPTPADPGATNGPPPQPQPATPPPAAPPNASA